VRPFGEKVHHGVNIGGSLKMQPTQALTFEIARVPSATLDLGPLDLSGRRGRLALVVKLVPT